jgi:hypothetical protein
MSINAAKENPNGRRSKDLTSKSNPMPLRGKGAKEETKKPREPPRGEYLISLKILLMPSHAMMGK